MITVSEKQAMIEDFERLILVSPEQIITESKQGRMIVEGSGLHIRVFSADEIILSGQIRREGRRIQLEQKQFILEYAAEDIVYIEAFGKKLVIHTDNRLSGRKEDTVSGYTLAGMLALLEGGPFVQCHKSYIVNRDYIDRIDKAGRKIYLKGFTEVVPVGNKYQAGLWGEA